MTMALGDRVLEPELMDDPALDVRAHGRALRGLARINRLSGSARAIWRGIRAALPAARELRVLDVACGSADVSLALVGHARRDGVTLAVTGCDLSASAVERARARASATGIAADFVELNVLAPGTLEARFSDEFDVVMTSLFLHHLEADTAVQLLGAMRDIAGQLIVVDDLIRDRFGYVLAATAPRLLTRSPVVHTDARLSVRAAFTVQEASGLAEAARLADVDISRHWPARYLLTARGAGQ